MSSARNLIFLFLLTTFTLTACNAQTPRKSTAPAGQQHVWKLQRVEKTAQVPNPVSPAHEMKSTRLFSMLLPEGWTSNFQWGPGPPDCANQMGRLNIVAASADKSTGIIIVPTQATYWSTNPMANRQRASMSQAWHFNCTVAQPKPLADGLAEAAGKAAQNSHAVGSVEPVPGLTSELPHIVEQANQSLAQVGQHMSAEAGRIRVSGTLDGKPVEMWVIAMQTQRSSNNPGASETITDTPLFAITFAPQGQLDANDKLLMAVLSSVQIDPEWTTYNQELITNILQTISNTNANIARIQQQMAQDNANAAAQQAQIRSNAANYASQIRSSVAQSRASALDHSSQQFALYMGDQAIYHDPASGQNVQLSSGYDHVWASSAGNNNSYILTDSPSYNPNGQAGGGSWTQMQMVR
jgi:hypothetical protein